MFLLPHFDHDALMHLCIIKCTYTGRPWVQATLVLQYVLWHRRSWFNASKLLKYIVPTFLMSGIRIQIVGLHIAYLLRIIFINPAHIHNVIYFINPVSIFHYKIHCSNPTPWYTRLCAIKEFPQSNFFLHYKIFTVNHLSANHEHI